MTGFGGTVRLPRLIGRARAVEVFLTGKKVSAGDAYRLGLVDKVIGTGSVLGSAIETAIKLKGRDLNELQSGYI
jgi:enoyl-CoA hydratase/carnithine racemase